MSLLVAWVVYPLVLGALCAGVGLLVDALLGRRLPGGLVLPTGLAAICVVGQFTTFGAATAELTVAVVTALAVLGAGLSLPWRFGRPDGGAVAATLAVFAIFAAPVVLTGEPTFAGYIKLDDTATWLAMTDQALESGRDLSGLEPSTYQATLAANLPAGYPIEVFLPFGAAQALVGGDLAWVFQPYLSFLAAMLALGLWQIAGAVLGRSGPRALVAFVAAQPALLFGYALWGGVKELAAAAFVTLAAALGPAAARPGAGAREAAVLALPAGALVGVLSLGGLAWLGPMLLLLAVMVVRADGWRRAGARASAFLLLALLCVAPMLLEGGFDPFQSGLTAEDELGNLIDPLNPVQLLGIWPSGDFRVDPSAAVASAVLIALGAFAAALGLWAAWRRRGAGLFLFASSLLACVAIVVVGSPWVDAKALATAGPAALLVAMTGAITTLRIDRPLGVVLFAAVAGGVLWSNVLAYGGADLAPYEQLSELQEIGDEFAGEGPALMTEYSAYGARHFLRELDAEGISELRVRTVPLRSGRLAEKGEAVDVDQVDLDALLEYRTLVLRRSPVRSRPPSPYRLVWAGDYYEVWQRRTDLTEPAPQHLPLGEELAPAAVPDCSTVRRLAQPGQNGNAKAGRLLAAGHARVLDATSGRLFVPRAGTYEAWLKGSVRGRVELSFDGQTIGIARHQPQNDGGFVRLGQARLGRGSHRAELRFGGADLHPGSGGFPRPEAGPLFLSRVDGGLGKTVTVPANEWSRLCGRPWDWIEALESG